MFKNSRELQKFEGDGFVGVEVDAAEQAAQVGIDLGRGGLLQVGGDGIQNCGEVAQGLAGGQAAGMVGFGVVEQADGAGDAAVQVADAVGEGGGVEAAEFVGVEPAFAAGAQVFEFGAQVWAGVMRRRQVEIVEVGEGVGQFVGDDLEGGGVLDVGMFGLEAAAAPGQAGGRCLRPHDGATPAVEEAGELTGFETGVGLAAPFEFGQYAFVGGLIP